MRYNLLTYGTLETLTESGTGNVELTAYNLSVLVDGITDSSYYYIPEGVKHYTVWSWTDKHSEITIRYNYLSFYKPGGSDYWRSGRCNISKSSGKWYWEIKNDSSYIMVGIATSSSPLSSYIGQSPSDTYGYSYNVQNGYLYHSGVGTPFGSSWEGQTAGIALDLDNGKIWFSRNGVWQGASADPVTGSGCAASLGFNSYFPSFSIYHHNTACGTANFGATDFSYTVPSGFNAGIQISDQGPYMSSVYLETTDTLYIEADLSNRIKIDELRMYLSSSTYSGTILGNINFYYKEELADSYTQLDKNYNSEYFYATNLSGVFTPRYLRYTIENTECILYEIEAYNDDDIVDFGNDGLLTEYVVTENTPDSVYSIPIFNDNVVSSLSAHAYVAVDYTNSGVLNYAIGISSSNNGPFYTLSDGLIIDDNYESSTYNWDHGEHSNTKEENGYLVLVLPNYSGTYQTTVFKFDDPYMSSYLSVGVTTESGTTAVGYDDNIFDSTIEVRNSNIDPLILSDIYWVSYETCGYSIYSSAGCRLYTYVYYDNTDSYIDLYYDSDTHVWGCGYLKNSKTKRSVRIIQRYWYWHIQKCYYDENNTKIWQHYSSGVNDRQFPNLGMDLDIYDNIWAYGNKYASQYHLTHTPPASFTELADVYSNGYVDFVADFAVELNGTGIWYTDKTTNNLIHLDSAGGVIGTVSMPSVGGVASTSDNGCWALDINNKQAFAFDYESTPLTVVNLVRSPTVNTINRMDTDRDDGFWYYSDDGYICHVDKYGKLGVEIQTSLVVTKVTGGDDIVMFYSSSERKFEVYNTLGVFFGSKTISNSCVCFFPTLMHSVDGVVNPQSYDPVWGENGSLGWNIVKNDGYFLPKTTYHQVRLTLRTYDVEKTPIVHNVVVPPAVKIQDIYPQQSRNVYFKSNLSGEVHGEYEVDLKVWWEI